MCHSYVGLRLFDIVSLLHAKASLFQFHMSTQFYKFVFYHWLSRSAFYYINLWSRSPLITDIRHGLQKMCFFDTDLQSLLTSKSETLVANYFIELNTQFYPDKEIFCGNFVTKRWFVTHYKDTALDNPAFQRFIAWYSRVLCRVGEKQYVQTNLYPFVIRGLI